MKQAENSGALAFPQTKSEFLSECMPLLRIKAKCANCSEESSGDFLEVSNGKLRCDNCGSVAVEFSNFPGYVYILGNPSYPGLLKIGLTHRAPEDRVGELGAATGVPTPFVLHAYCPSRSPTADESAIHSSFPDERCSEGREFFKIELLAAIDAVVMQTGEQPVFLDSQAKDLLRQRAEAQRARIQASTEVAEKAAELLRLQQAIQTAQCEESALLQKVSAVRTELAVARTELAVAKPILTKIEKEARRREMVKTLGRLKQTTRKQNDLPD